MLRESTSEPALRLSAVQKSFGSTRALRDASLTLQPGEITALIGENGAGKSTLVKILSGVHQPDAGELRIDGRLTRITDPEHARRLGISVVHQECLVFDNLSVAENLFVSARPRHRGIVSWRDMRTRAGSVLKLLSASFDPDAPAGQLSIAQKHVVQIARALTSEARVLIMDEPTAALSYREAADLFEVTRRIAKAGCAILFISHKFDEIFAVADRFAVFRDGASVGAGWIRETNPAQIIRLMVGRDIEQLFSKPTVPIGAELLRVDGLARAREFADVSFGVRRGEILGVYGLVGAGRTEVAQSLFGLKPADRGTISLDGRPVAIGSPADAIRQGLAYVPEDRQKQGAILQFSIAANIGLPNLAQISRAGICIPRRETALARKWIASLSIKTAGPGQSVGDLSGGNQQKVVLARWLATDPRILILDEPTKGVDIGARSAVHAVTGDFARRGNAVIMISSDLPEILGMSDRVLVMRRGRVTALLDRADATAERILHAATHA
jgi:rhamnose transport system ATP-binding protein